MEAVGGKTGKDGTVFVGLSADGCLFENTQKTDCNDNCRHLLAAVQCVCDDICGVSRAGAFRRGDAGRCPGSGGGLHCGGHAPDSGRPGHYGGDVPQRVPGYICGKISGGVGVHHAGSQFLSDAARRVCGVYDKGCTK